jgi:hypothetical protein
MDKHEHERLARQENTLLELGFTFDEAKQLRRISNTLRRWYELECGTSDQHNVQRSIERDKNTGKPFIRYQYQDRAGWHDKSWPMPDREKGAERRLNAIIMDRNVRRTFYSPLDAKHVTAYLQTDPRGSALYILRPGDVPEGKDPAAYYNRGICVY